MQLVGILRWLVELGQIDICVETLMLASYNSMSRVGHLHAVLHVFAYLQYNINWKLVMDPQYHEDFPFLEKHDWE